MRWWTGFNWFRQSGKKFLKDFASWILQLLHVLVRHHQSYQLSFAVEAIISAFTEEVKVATAYIHYIIQITSDVAPLCHWLTYTSTGGLAWIVHPVQVICTHRPQLYSVWTLYGYETWSVSLMKIRKCVCSLTTLSHEQAHPWRNRTEN